MRASSVRSRSSIGRVPALSPASLGNAASNHCAKAWMVSIRSPPPGQSSTAANSVRARSRVAGSSSAPIASNSRPSPVGSIRTQRARICPIRVTISAAPALVNVRHKTLSGRAPGSSSKRNTREVSTWVLPVPAEADSQTLSAGATASA